MLESAASLASNAKSGESPVCSGFSADTYDRYVLGLLDQQERAKLDTQIENQCAICIKGVQRSMNLWLVFANNLEQVEPSADFRARLIRIADLSKRVLTVPKRNRRVREPAIFISSLVVICLIAILLLVFAWIAGRQFYRLNLQREAGDIKDLQDELAANQVQLQQQIDRNEILEKKLSSSGRLDVAQQRLEDQLSRAQAEIQQYKTSISRDKEQTTDNSTLVTALTSPGVRLLTFTNAEGSPSTAYGLVIENTKVIFIASKLPELSPRHQFQLWLVRKAEPHFVAAGIFSRADEKPVVLTYDQDKDAISNIVGLLVTEQEIDGAYTEPSNLKVLETSGIASVTAPAGIP